MKEIWKKIEGFEELYKISNLGRVKNKNKVMYTKNNNRGYRIVILSKNGKQHTKTIHRLVAKAFIPNKEKKSTVNHIDGNKQNNSCTNLSWATHSENTRHAIDVLKTVNSPKKYKKKIKYLKENQVRDIYKMHLNGVKTKEICRYYNIGLATVYDIVNGRTWKKLKLVK